MMEMAYINPGTKTVEVHRVQIKQDTVNKYKTEKAKTGYWEINTDHLATCHAMVIMSNNAALMTHFQPSVCEVLGASADKLKSIDKGVVANAEAAIKELKGLLKSRKSQLATAEHKIHFVHGPQGAGRSSETVGQMGNLLKEAGYTGQKFEHTSRKIVLTPEEESLSAAQRDLVLDKFSTAGVKSLGGKGFAVFVTGDRSDGQACTGDIGSSSNHKRANKSQSAGKIDSCTTGTSTSSRPTSSNKSSTKATKTAVPTKTNSKAAPVKTTTKTAQTTKFTKVSPKTTAKAAPTKTVSKVVPTSSTKATSKTTAKARPTKTKATVKAKPTKTKTAAKAKPTKTKTKTKTQPKTTPKSKTSGKGKNA